MSYRDDLEAAVARADALAQDLADAHAHEQRDEARLAELTAALAEARRELAARAALATPLPSPSSSPTPSRPTRPRGNGEFLLLPMGILFFVFIVVIAWNVSQQPASHPRTAPLSPVAASSQPRPTRPPPIDFDPSTALDEATRRATAVRPDAALAELRAEGVTSNGHAHGSVTYTFCAPRQDGRDCARLFVEVAGTTLSDAMVVTGSCCEPTYPPRCTTTTLFGVEARRGVVATDADLTYASGTWTLSMRDRNGLPYQDIVHDEDCR